MSDMPRRITLEEWDLRYEQLQRAGVRQPDYGGPLSRHLDDGDQRLLKLRHLAFTAELCPLPALEMLIAEMLAIHFCSDRRETIDVLKELLDEVQARVQTGVGILDADAAKIF